MVNYVSGYWNRNLGDDLFLKILCERYPEEKFSVFVRPGAEKTLNGLKNLSISTLKQNLVSRVANKLEYKLNTFLPFSDYWQILHRLPRHSNYIEIGGSIFMMPVDRNDGGIEYKRRMKIVNRVDQYYVLGSNFGPYYGEEQLEQYDLFFDSVNSVSFRDQYSYSLFQGSGNSHYAPDIVFQLAPVYQSVPKIKDQYTVISVVNPCVKVKNNQLAKKNYDEIIKKIIIDSIENKQKVVLLSFCDNEGDLKYCQEIFNSMSIINQTKIEIVPYTNMYESLNILQNSHRIVASRYHAMVLAWLMRKPVYVISYSRKITNVIQDTFPTQSYFDLLGGMNGDDISFSLLDQGSLNNLIHKSNSHFRDLDRLFNH